ncbi:MAG TPA: FAD-dependent monooxygenase [Solirubrobacteraceae bacterium]|jgi:2-polyprenyl-6-methoxyphenol hydroxylase-like FAD-dependent oxidoreductase
MSRIVVLGGGICGLASAMMLARDGHDVLVLERDSARAPDSAEEAWADWERGGVTQFRLAHLLLPAGRAVLETELPEAIASLSAAGASRFDFLAAMPPMIADRRPRPGDERFVTVTARRPVLEQVLARLAERQPGLDVRRGVTVTGLTSLPRGTTPHITGVRLASGEVIAAELVVDASGRRSRLPQWLRAVGARPVPEESEDSGFTYYQRTFRSADGSVPMLMAPVGSPIGTIMLITLPADNGTWAVVVATSSGDQPLKRLREATAWSAVVRACPLHAHWLEGEPITPVEAMGGLIDRRRRFAPDGRPVATGIAAVADAWACTNPSLGRGISYGLRHAQRLRDTVREHVRNPAAFAVAWDHVTEHEMRPFYEDVISENRLRRSEIDALRNDLEPPKPGARAARFFAAALHDADAFRGYLETRAGLATMREVIDRPALAQRIDEPGIPAPIPLPGPNRAQLLDLLTNAAAHNPHRARPGAVSAPHPPTSSARRPNV